jgi:5-methylcytosine-specific restriction endonuclease McrA
MDDPRRSDWRAPGFPTLDHLIPASKGGTDDPENLKLAHRSCNRAKGDRLPDGMVWRPAGADGLRGGLDGGMNQIRRLA